MSGSAARDVVPDHPSVVVSKMAHAMKGYRLHETTSELTDYTGHTTNHVTAYSDIASFEVREFETSPDLRTVAISFRMSFGGRFPSRIPYINQSMTSHIESVVPYRAIVEVEKVRSHVDGVTRAEGKIYLTNVGMGDAVRAAPPEAPTLKANPKKRARRLDLGS